MSLNNTVEFFKLSITIIKLLLIKTERFDPKVFFSSIQKTKPNSLFIYGQITSDDIMTVQRVRTMMHGTGIQRVVQKITRFDNDGTRKVNYDMKV